MIVPPEYAAGCTEPLTLGSKLVLLAIVAIVAGVVVSLIVSALTSSSPIRTATFLVVALVVGAVVWPKLDDIRSFCSGKNEYEQLYNREMAQYDDSGQGERLRIEGDANARARAAGEELLEAEHWIVRETSSLFSLEELNQGGKHQTSDDRSLPTTMQVVRDLHPVPPFHTHPVVYAVPSVHTGRESTTFSAITDAMQDYGTRTFPHRGSRVTLGIARTLLRDKKGSRLPFWGAFALEDLPKGAFLGFYSGTFYDEGEVEEGLVSVPSSHYSINASGFTVVPPSPVTPDRYPMAMLNEPPDGVVASVALVEWTKRKQIDPSSPKSNEIVYNVAMHTSHRRRQGGGALLPLRQEVLSQALPARHQGWHPGQPRQVCGAARRDSLLLPGKARHPPPNGRVRLRQSSERVEVGRQRANAARRRRQPRGALLEHSLHLGEGVQHRRTGGARQDSHEVAECVLQGRLLPSRQVAQRAGHRVGEVGGVQTGVAFGVAPRLDETRVPSQRVPQPHVGVEPIADGVHLPRRAREALLPQRRHGQLSDAGVRPPLAEHRAQRPMAAPGRPAPISRRRRGRFSCCRPPARPSGPRRWRRGRPPSACEWRWPRSSPRSRRFGRR